MAVSEFLDKAGLVKLVENIQAMPDGETIEYSGEPKRLHISDAMKPGVDKVIAQGKSGEWNYRKWQSGWAELWAMQTVSGSDIDNAWGAVYEHEAWTLGQYPIEFVSRPSVFISSEGDSIYVSQPYLNTRWSQSSQDAPLYFVTRPTTANNVTYYANWYVIGRWK